MLVETMLASKYILVLTCVFAEIWQDVNGKNPLKIVNGEEVTPHSLPYMASLTSVINGRTVHCGGSLISTKKVLTAASCLYGAEKVTVVLGAHNIQDKEDTQVVLESSKFTIHEDYNPKKHHNDIATITLPEEVKLTDNIKTIKTPALADILKTYADDGGLVSGWGKYDENQSTFSDVLRSIEVTIIPYLSCTVSYLFSIQTNQICTSGMQGGRNICTGDSGDPLVVKGVQVGIASYGSSISCFLGSPGVHTRLTSYYSWLLDH